MRGGANGGRLRLAPQKDWEVNQPAELQKVLAQSLEAIQKEFNAQNGSKKVSMADLIVLAGCAGVEAGSQRRLAMTLIVPFAAGRTDATQEMTDVESFAVLEPAADGFRNYARNLDRPAPEVLVDRAHRLTLTAPEMTALIGGLRALNANVGKSTLGVLTQRPEQLTNDFFVNLLDLNTQWKKSSEGEDVYEGVDRESGDTKWKATSVDLVFGSNSQLRAIAEVYASADSESKFVNDFVAAWTKVMNLDRFDVESQN